MSKPVAGPRPLALVTGGWRRVGAAIARALAADGWDLALHAHHRSAFDESLTVELGQAGARVTAIEADLADVDAPARLIDEAGARTGRPVSLLVNCASLFHEGTLATTDLDDLEAHFRVNLHAPVLLTKAFAAALGAGAGSEGGAVVNVLDQRVVNPVPDQFAYTLSKQALHASVRTLARALAPRIRVNAVAPGPVLPTADYSDEQWRCTRDALPLQSLPTPEAIAAAVVFLARAPATTGQTLFVDGGANLEAYPRDFLYL